MNWQKYTRFFSKMAAGGHLGYRNCIQNNRGLHRYTSHIASKFQGNRLRRSRLIVRNRNRQINSKWLPGGHLGYWISSKNNRGMRLGTPELNWKFHENRFRSFPVFVWKAKVAERKKKKKFVQKRKHPDLKNRDANYRITFPKNWNNLFRNFGRGYSKRRSYSEIKKE